MRQCYYKNDRKLSFFGPRFKTYFKVHQHQFTKETNYSIHAKQSRLKYKLNYQGRPAALDNVITDHDTPHTWAKLTDIMGFGNGPSMGL